MTGGNCDSEEEKRGEGKQASIAGKFSGTRIRNCAYEVTDLDYFCEGTTTNGKTGPERKRLGMMTKQLSYCLLNDIRKRVNLDPISIQQWNDNVSKKYKLIDDIEKPGPMLTPADEGYSRAKLFLAQHGATGGGKRKTQKKRKKKRKRKTRKKRKRKTKKHKNKKNKRRRPKTQRK